MPPSQRYRGSPASAAAALAEASEQPRIALAPSLALRLRPVELDEDPVDLALIGRVDPGERPGDFAVDVGDRLQHALAQVELGIPVAELDRLVLARRRSGGYGGATEGAGGQSDVDLERGIPARVQDLAAVDVRDPAHTRDAFARS